VTQLGPEGRDPGLAYERTDLAWNRSGLSLIACGAVVMKGLAVPPFEVRNVAAGMVILVLGGITWALGSVRMRRTRGRGVRPVGAAELRPIALGVALVGVAAFVVAAVSTG
jgi:uncharacterized membrane protein YidH (DUF202 family)